jgi:hypothetical protein
MAGLMQSKYTASKYLENAYTWPYCLSLPTINFATQNHGVVHFKFVVNVVEHMRHFRQKLF